MYLLSVTLLKSTPMYLVKQLYYNVGKIVLNQRIVTIGFGINDFCEEFIYIGDLQIFLRQTFTPFRCECNWIHIIEY